MDTNEKCAKCGEICKYVEEEDSYCDNCGWESEIDLYHAEYLKRRCKVKTPNPNE